MRRNLLLSGGFDRDHDFSTSVSLADLLSDLAVDTDVENDIEAGLRRLAGGGYELVTCNALRWGMATESYRQWRDRFGFSLSAEGRAALTAYMHGGGSLLAMHTAVICFDDWPEWRSILGGSWSWGRSGHPPLGPVSVVVSGSHPVVAGVDDFNLIDEVYGALDMVAGVTPLLTADVGSGPQPLVWARGYGRGRVVVDTLGHDRRSYAVDAHARVVRQAATWLLGTGE